jgi:hypothetical protein
MENGTFKRKIDINRHGLRLLYLTCISFLSPLFFRYQSFIMIGIEPHIALNISMQEWKDANMRWNTSEYGNVQDVRIPPRYIWTPDLLMYNR